MTGRDRVKAALTFSSPDRVPRDLWALPYITLFRKDEKDTLLAEHPLDIAVAKRHKPDQPDPYFENTARVGTYTDDWGSVWHVGEASVSGEVTRPALS